MELRDRIAVVTGGAGGIGFEIARAFLDEDAAHVVVLDLDPDRVDEAVGRLGDRARGRAVDVSDETALGDVIDRVRDEVGPVDVMVSNAGIGTGMGVEADADTWDRIWQVNVLAHVHAARAVLPDMLERGEGYLVSVASAAGLLAQIGDLPYSVTKHGAVAVAEWLSLTYRDRGIRVSCVCPQGVRTDLIAAGSAVGAAAVDTVVSEGLIEPDQVAADLIEAMDEERFLVLPHPEVAAYSQRRTADPDRWLEGMSRLQAQILGGPGRGGGFGADRDGPP